jgi:hypothetical protein
MRILCAINPPAAIKKILDCLGLPSRPPPIYPAVPGDPADYFAISIDGCFHVLYEFHGMFYFIAPETAKGIQATRG